MLQASLSKFEAKILTSSFKIILLNFLQAVVIFLPSIDYLIGIFLYPLNIFAVGTRKTSCPDWSTILQNRPAEKFVYVISMFSLAPSSFSLLRNQSPEFPFFTMFLVLASQRQFPVIVKPSKVVSWTISSALSSSASLGKN